MTLLLSRLLPLLACTALCSALMFVGALIAGPRLLRQRAPSSAPTSVLPHGIVLMLAALASISFLVEGAVLDWGALLVTDVGLMTPSHGGVGYAIFSLAMTAGRLVGDRTVERFGDRPVLTSGSLMAIAGFVLVVIAPGAVAAMTGFFFIGFGAANIVPILFRRAGSQKQMPVGLAISTITTIGYTGVLVGPALIGFIAKAISLQGAFLMLGALMSVVTLCSRVVTRGRDC